MKIIDAQVHVWSQAVIPPGDGHRQITRYTPEDLLAEMDAAGVHGGSLHPPGSWDPTSNAYAIEAAKKYPDRFAIMGWFPPENPENVKLIPDWLKQPGMKGIRMALLYGEQPEMMKDGRLDWLWPAAEKAGVPFSTVASMFLKKFRWIAETHPNLKLIIDHCGLNRLSKDAGALSDLDEVVALAKLPNVALKATAVQAYSTESYPYKNMHDALHRLFDAFGPDRMFWGTDITRMHCTYRQCVTLFTEELPWLKGQDLEKVMGRGLAKWICWDFKFT
jgi:predicted TIM-barrel fold metal-dependent hydrolase